MNKIIKCIAPLLIGVSMYACAKPQKIMRPHLGNYVHEEEWHSGGKSGRVLLFDNTGKGHIDRVVAYLYCGKNSKGHPFAYFNADGTLYLDNDMDGTLDEKIENAINIELHKVAPDCP